MTEEVTITIICSKEGNEIRLDVGPPEIPMFNKQVSIKKSELIAGLLVTKIKTLICKSKEELMKLSVNLLDVKNNSEDSETLVGDMDSVVGGYLEAGMWASPVIDDSNNVSDEVLSDSYGVEDISQELMKQAINDTAKFVKEAGDLLKDVKPAQIGHDLFLTRSGYGTGFWDRGLGAKGDKLTEIAEAMGTLVFYLGDDGKIYGE